MNRKEAKQLLPIIKAFAEGKPIQYRYKGNKTAKWEDIDKECHEFAPEFFMYRVTPALKYRPFANADECWQEMQKHQPFGWVKCKEDGSLGLITLIISEENIFINGVGCNSERTMRGFTFADGTPFGILEED